jgi:hypothetical protein
MRARIDRWQRDAPRAALDPVAGGLTVATVADLTGIAFVARGLECGDRLSSPKGRQPKRSLYNPAS